jgi:hypothetical protein
MNTRDYVDHNPDLSKSAKKGKYGVTVPKPFGFDVREQTKKKTIRERKLDEMIAEKEIIEKNLIKHQFRHNPIPPEVSIPKYKSIVEANEQRRINTK